MPNLAEIRERWSKGTPGPWMNCHSPQDTEIRLIKADTDKYNERCVFYCTKEKDLDDADKIANAPTDIAFLLAEVERLRKRCNKQQGKIMRLGKGNNRLANGLVRSVDFVGQIYTELDKEKYKEV